jgi:hypothetical protein
MCKKCSTYKNNPNLANVFLSDSFFVGMIAINGNPKTGNVKKVIACPNPVSVGDNLNLQLPDSFVGGYMNVIRFSGSTVKQKLPVAGRFGTLSVAYWSPGIYLLKVVSPDGDRETVKIIMNN